MTTRQRSTWSKPGSEAAPRQAATSRRADVYTMNQEHPQPSVLEYESGDPDSWAETPTTNKNVEMDYEGDHVRRNEVGFAEFRKDTFDHKDSKEWGGGGKYDNAREAAVQRKASYALDLSRELLRTDNAEALMDQATELMSLPSRSIASALRRIEALSPDALPHDRKLRRATACCKLAARMLPEAAEEADVERLASTLMRVDDPTLRSILKVVASVRVAEEKEQQTQQGQQEQQAKEQQEQQAQQAQGQQQDQEQQAQQQDEGCLSSADMAALDQMLAEEGCAPMPAPAAPVPAPAAPELTTIFQPPVMAADGSPAPAQVASDDTENGIHFDEEDGEGHVAAESAELESLFDEHPEVMAQREIRSAEAQVAAAQGGYGTSPATRTASSSAKKIGNVQAAPAPRRSPDDDLAVLWDRPPAM